MSAGRVSQCSGIPYSYVTYIYVQAELECEHYNKVVRSVQVHGWDWLDQPSHALSPVLAQTHTKPFNATRRVRRRMRRARRWITSSERKKMYIRIWRKNKTKRNNNIPPAPAPPATTKNTTHNKGPLEDTIKKSTTSAAKFFFPPKRISSFNLRMAYFLVGSLTRSSKGGRERAKRDRF